jgi:hypothetical protein
MFIERIGIVRRSRRCSELIGEQFRYEARFAPRILQEAMESRTRRVSRSQNTLTRLDWVASE